MAAKYTPANINELVAQKYGPFSVPDVPDVIPGMTQEPVMPEGPQGAQITYGEPTIAPQTDWGNVAGAGIGAAGQAVGTLAQLAGQKAAWDQQAQQADAGRALSMRLAKMQLGQNQQQFDMTQAFKALEWALQANKALQTTGTNGRELRRSSSDMLSDVLRRVYLKH